MVAAFAIPPEPFAAKFVTPTLKLKRREVEAHYAELIASLYEQAAGRGLDPDRA